MRSKSYRGTSIPQGIIEQRSRKELFKAINLIVYPFRRSLGSFSRAKEIISRVRAFSLVMVYRDCCLDC